MNDIPWVILFFFAALFLAPVSPWAQEMADEDAFLAAAEAELENPEYQKELPVPEPREANNLNLQIPEWLGAVLRIVFWIAAAILIIFLLYQAYRYFEDRKLTPSAKTDSQDRPVRHVKMAGDGARIPTLDEVEALAAKGHYTEAIHLLLLVALNALFNRLKTGVPRSHTSREILNDKRLLATWRTDLTILVRAVEEALFAGKAPGKKSYESCRQTFDSLAASLRDGQ